MALENNSICMSGIGPKGCRRNKRVRGGHYQFSSKLNSSVLITSFVPWTTATEDTNPLELGLLHLCFFLHLSLSLSLLFFFSSHTGTASMSRTEQNGLAVDGVNARLCYIYITATLAHVLTPSPIMKLTHTTCT